MMTTRNVATSDTPWAKHHVSRENDAPPDGNCGIISVPDLVLRGGHVEILRLFAEQEIADAAADRRL